MKRFLTVSLLLAVSAAAMACAYPSTHNYYVFSVFNRNLMSDRFGDITNKNWEAYTEGAVKEYNADKVMNYARSKGDTEMMAYLRLLNQYLSICGWDSDAWEYPSREQIMAQSAKLRTIRTQAQAKVRSKLRSQNALLVMRCNMQLENHQGNIKFWNETGQNMREAVYRDMMKDIYAHALLKTGRKNEALEVYAELQDMVSIKWCLEGDISLEAIRNLYAQAPNSAGLPFLVQRFVNDAQDLVDVSPWTGESQEISPDFEREVKQFIAFGQQVATEGKTQSPVLWQSAAAWMEYLFGQASTAKKIADKSEGMEGTQRMMDNARVIRLIVNMATAKNSKATDRFVTQELQWLEDVAATDRDDPNDYGNHYTEMLDRLVYCHLAKRYDQWGRGEVATALFGVLSEGPVAFSPWNFRSPKRQPDATYNSDYNNDFFVRINDLRAKDLVAYVEYINSNTDNPLQQWLSRHNYRNADYLNDLIGTKYLAEGDLAKAIEYEEKVALKFLATQNISQYMDQRSYVAEPWLKDQRCDLDGAFLAEPKVNKKLQFAKDMNQLLTQFSIGKESVRQEAAYKLAIMSYQASYLGDCWFITHYGKSVSDTARVGELDYVSEAVKYLNVAKQTKDVKLKEKALFGLAFIPLEPWSESKWSDKASDFVTVINRTNRQYRAFEELLDFYKKNPKSPFASKCDILKQFEKNV